MSSNSTGRSTLTPQGFRFEVQPISTWHKWLELAQAATTLEQKVGLLHVGFETQLNLGTPYGVTYTKEDRFKFYFGVADGWTSPRELLETGILAGDDPAYLHVGWNKEGRSFGRTRSEQRQVLAKKAFDVLAIEFFKDWLNQVVGARTSRSERGLYKTLLEGPLFPVIQNFFRCDDRRDGVRNLTYFWNEERWTSQEKIMLEFLLLLPEMLWTWEEEEINSYEKPERVLEKQQANETNRAIVENAKVWIVEVLDELRRLNLLERWLFDLSEPCLKKLEEIALDNKLKGWQNAVRGARPVATVREACVVGSSAALLLLRHEVVTAELARLREVREAEVAQEAATEAERQLAITIETARRQLEAAEATLRVAGLSVDTAGRTLGTN